MPKFLASLIGLQHSSEQDQSLVQRVYKGSRGGACIPKRDFPKFYRIDKAGELNLEDAITERYELNNINEAIRIFRSGEAGRIVLNMA